MDFELDEDDRAVSLSGAMMLQSTLDKVAFTAENLDIQSRQDLVTANEMIGISKSFLNQVEKERKKLKRPHVEENKKIDEAAKNIREKVQPLIDKLEIKVFLFLAEQTRKAEGVFVPRPEVVSESGSAAVTKKVVWEIEDFSKIPAECWSERTEQVKAAISPWVNVQIKSGVLNIPGIKIDMVDALKTRTKGKNYAKQLT